MKRKWLPVLFLPWSVIILDQWTKIEIVNRFLLGESVSVINNYFNLTYVQNLGAAFGILADTHSNFRIPFFIVIPLFALGVIGYLFRKLNDSDWKMSAALCLIIGGAIGNLIDRIRVGYVIDFLDFHWQHKAHFAAFNVADAAICVGVGILLLDVFANHPEDENGANHASRTP